MRGILGDFLGVIAVEMGLMALQLVGLRRMCRIWG